MPSHGEFLIDRLLGAGIKTVFTVPGDYCLEFCDKVSNSELKLVNCCNEMNAGYAADAYARVNGAGALLVTYCVGGLSALNAVAGAYAEKSPLVVISGSPGIKERNQELLLHHMVGPFECQKQIYDRVTCASTVLSNPAMSGYEVDRVLDACKYYKQPIYIELPRDMVNAPIVYDSWAVGTPPHPAKSDEHNLQEALDESVEWIENAKNPVILAGVEVSRYGFGKQLMKFAESTNIPVATTLLGKSVVNENHLLSLGVFCGNLSSGVVNDAINNSDCIIMLGVLMTDINMGFWPHKIMRRNAILATCSDMQVRNHSFKKVNFVDFFTRLMKYKISKRTSPVKEKITKKKYVPENSAITIRRLMERVQEIVNDNIAIVADIGDALFAASEITVGSNHFLGPAFYGSMGFAVPGALGVQKALSDIRPIVFVGDGAFQMTGQELSTIIREKLNPIIFVLNNGCYNTESFFKDGPYNQIASWKYHELPGIYGGGGGHVVKTEDDLEKALKESLIRKDEPSVINVFLSKSDYSDGLKRVMDNLAARGGFK